MRRSLTAIATTIAGAGLLVGCSDAQVFSAPSTTRMVKPTATEDVYVGGTDQQPSTDGATADQDWVDAAHAEDADRDGVGGRGLYTVCGSERHEGQPDRGRFVHVAGGDARRSPRVRGRKHTDPPDGHLDEPDGIPLTDAHRPSRRQASEATAGRIKRNATPRWLMAAFSSGLCSAIVRPSGSSKIGS